MPAKTYRLLRQVYYQHGLLTFLLMFVPVLPGVVESHTRMYIRLLKLFAGDFKDAREAIRVVFGKRGLSAFEQYILNHPNIIRPSQIYRLIYQDGDLDAVLDLVSSVYFDVSQRTHPLSHEYRAALASEMPFIMQWAKAEHQLYFRQQLVEILLKAVEVEQAPEAKTAISKALDQIHNLASTQLRRQETNRLNRELQLLESHLKANLTPFSSIYSMPHYLNTSKTEESLFIPLSLTETLNQRLN